MLLKQIKNILFVHIPVVLLFFQYQINWLYEDSLIKPALDIAIFTLVALFVIKQSDIKFVRAGMLVIFLVAILMLPGMPKAIAAALVFGYGFCIVAKSNNSFNYALKVLFIINGIIILLQIIGIDAIFYKFQFYSPENPEAFIAFWNDEEGHVPVFQSRVSGVFPSTIYLALFQFLIFGQWIASKNHGNNNISFLTGFIFALIASTVSVLLFLFSFIYLLRKKRSFYFQFGFLMGLLFLIVFCPPIFDENYSFAEKVTRIDTRFTDDGGHSALTDSLVNFSIALCLISVLLSGLWFYAKKWGQLNAMDVITFLLVSISPLLVHAILEDVRYWFVLGATFAQLYISTFDSNPVLNRGT